MTTRLTTAPRKCSELSDLASRWRRAIERTTRASFPGLAAFPQGACGDASLLLAEYLRDQACAYDDALYVAGEFESEKGFGGGHAWLEWRGIIVDITSDQFDHGPRVPVFVAAVSSWHSAFLSVTRSPARIAHYDDRTRSTLMHWYRTIRQQL